MTGLVAIELKAHVPARDFEVSLQMRLLVRRGRLVLSVSAAAGDMRQSLPSEGLAQPSREGRP
jgi:hypothetical protein